MKYNVKCLSDILKMMDSIEFELTPKITRGDLLHKVEAGDWVIMCNDKFLNELEDKLND